MWRHAEKYNKPAVKEIEFGLPKGKQFYCVTTAMMHYAKGAAWTATGNVVEAVKEQYLLRKSKGLAPRHA